MKILALETSAAACSAALCQDGTLLAQSWQNSGLTHSRTLLPLVDSMLKNCGASLKEVEVIAVAAGPGSFTGLRIGVATAKGLAWPEDKPCAPCSTLESMAWPLAHLEGRVIVCAMDARRSQVYNALFLAAGEGLQRLTPDRAIGLDQLGEELKKVEKEKIVVGDGARLCYNTLTEQGITLKMAPEHLRMQSAWGVARAALELVRSGGLVSGEELAPVYCRLSQAERERLERENGRDPTLAEIAGELDVTVEEIVEAMESGAEVESLQKTIYQGENHDISLMDRIPEKENGQEKLLNRLFLEELLGRLPAKERQLIYMRYFQDMTQAQIAGKLGISQVQVSRMEKKILRQMRMENS